MAAVSDNIHYQKKISRSKTAHQIRWSYITGIFLDLTVRKAMVPGQRNRLLVCILKRLR